MRIYATTPSPRGWGELSPRVHIVFSMEKSVIVALFEVIVSTFFCLLFFFDLLIQCTCTYNPHVWKCEMFCTWCSWVLKTVFVFVYPRNILKIIGVFQCFIKSLVVVWREVKLSKYILFFKTLFMHTKYIWIGYDYPFT